MENNTPESPKDEKDVNLLMLKYHMLQASANAYSAFAHLFVQRMEEAKEYVEKAKTAFFEAEVMIGTLIVKEQQQEAKMTAASSNNAILNGDNNYWIDATDFAKTLMGDDMEEKFINYCNEKKLNRNEILFFKHLLGEVFEFKFTMAMLKNSI